jgi:hypothetical protein
LVATVNRQVFTPLSITGLALEKIYLYMYEVMCVFSLIRLQIRMDNRYRKHAKGFFVMK